MFNYIPLDAFSPNVTRPTPLGNMKKKVFRYFLGAKGIIGENGLTCLSNISNEITARKSGLS